MNATISSIRHPVALHDTPDPAAPAVEPALRTVPEKPTLDMLTAGSQAGGISIATVWNIWQAMLKAAG